MRLSEHTRGILMGREWQQGQKSANYAVGFGTRSLWDYLLMQQCLYPTLVRPGEAFEITIRNVPLFVFDSLSCSPSFGG